MKHIPEEMGKAHHIDFHGEMLQTKIPSVKM